MHSSELSVGKQGRLVIPAKIRNQLAIGPGTKLLAGVENGRIIMETKQQLWQSVHAPCASVSGKKDLAQSLIDERQTAAKLENQ